VLAPPPPSVPAMMDVFHGRLRPALPTPRKTTRDCGARHEDDREPRPVPDDKRASPEQKYSQSPFISHPYVTNCGCRYYCSSQF